MLTVINVAGARPNFVKVGPLHGAMVTSGRIRPIFVHTGQHYDENMSEIFLTEFGLPRPDYQLDVGSGTHARQTAEVMARMEDVLIDVRPDYVVVVGDVNSTMAAALTSVKLGIRTAHVEAGLRSFDRTMPEEINRVVTDAVADLLFSPSRDGVDNLLREGVSSEKIHFVGNVMIDSLDALLPRALESRILDEMGLESRNYVLSTLHRPSNVDSVSSLEAVVSALEGAAEAAPTVLVAHPRTSSRLQEFGLVKRLTSAGVILREPMGYIDFLRLTHDAAAVLTDSGGIQEETTVLGVPCVTMRTSTERPVTVIEGTNRLVGEDPQRAVDAIVSALARPREMRRPELWDGAAAARIVDVLLHAAE